MTVINTNTASINAQFNLNKVNQEMEKAMEQLSSGKRINSAADDAAGLSIATRMESQVRGLNQAMRNAADGQSMVDTAEGAMDEITNMLQRMRELALQASSDTNTATDRAAMNEEVEQLKSEINRVVSTTTHNSKSLLNGSSPVALQIGSFAGETLDFQINDMSTGSLGSLSGASPVGTVTSASFAGVEATTTQTQLTFNGNDSYEFNLTYSVDGGSDQTVLIEADVVGGSAKDVVDQINSAIRDTTAPGTGTDAATRHIKASFSGNVVTIDNTYGGKITVAKNSSNAFANAGSTIAFSSIEGGNSSSNLVLGDNAQNVTTFSNAGASGTVKVPSSIILKEPTAALEDYVAATAATAGVTVTGTSGNTDNTILTLTDADGTAIDSWTVAHTATDDAATTMTALKTLIDNDTTGPGAAYSASIAAGVLTVSGSDGVNFTATLTTDDGSSGAAGGTIAATAVTSTNGVEAVDENTYEIVLTAGATSLTLSHTFEDGSAGDHGTNAPADGALLNGLLQNFANLTDDQKSGFSIDSSTSGQLKFTRDDGVDFKVEYGTNNTAKNTLLTNTGASGASDATLAVAGVTTTNGDEGTGDTTSRMYLQINGADDYTFNIVGEDTSATAITTAVSFSFDGQTSDLGNVASKIENLLNASNKFGSGTSAHDFEVTVEDGLVVITDNLGKDFDLTSFTSAGAGRIAASNAVGQTTSGAAGAVILDDVSDGQSTATTTAAGTATATAVKMSFSADDNYSFTISDGTATAVINNVGFGAAGIDAATEGTGMQDAINDALARAGLGGVIGGIMHATLDTSAARDTITITSNEGREILIDNFKSDTAATLLVEATGTNNTGVSRFLDDGALTSSDVVSKLSLETRDDASSAIDVIDRALEDINAERSKLGAISNRLDHTISNLGNIVVNTEASQSRIQDADFAKVTGDLTKSQIMSQAATAMLAQANASKQGVLSLLQG